MKAIGLTAGRSILAPEFATLESLGVMVRDLDVFVALVGPTSLSRGANERLAREVPNLIRSAEVRQRLFNVGWQAQGTAPEALRLRVKSETNVMGGIIVMQGIKVE